MYRCIYFALISIVLILMIMYSNNTFISSANVANFNVENDIESIDEICVDRTSVVDYILGKTNKIINDNAPLSKSDFFELRLRLYSIADIKYINNEIPVISSDSVTMAEFVWMISPLLKDEANKNTVEHITDVFTSNPLYNEIVHLYRTGIFVGDKYGAFNESEYVTIGTAKSIIERINDTSKRCVYNPGTTQNSKILDVNYILQNPELPTGCEITSLAMVLNYFGYDANKCYLADNYLKRCDYGCDIPYNAFIGSPYYDNGFGCFSPVITASANKFLHENDSNLTAYDISGVSVEKLFLELEQGYPVIVWATMYMMETEWIKCWVINGEDVYFPVNEHCLVLTGFDLDKNVVFFSDPLKGNCQYNLDTFKLRYEQLLKQAVVIK